MAGPQVLLADDHPIVLAGLRALLSDRCELVGTVNDGPSLVAAAVALDPEIVVADLSMPGFSGIQAVRQMRALGVRAKVIILTMHADLDLVEEALASGAHGYVIKTSAGEELLEAIRAVSDGTTYVSASLRRPRTA